MTITETSNAKAAPVIATEAPSLTVPKLAVRQMLVPIVGTSSLIMHNFSAKSKKQMLDSMQGQKRQKTIREPEADYQEAFYRIADADGKDRYGFPAVGFKSAVVSAARFFDKSITMTTLRQLIFIEGVRTPGDAQELVEIFGSPVMREDVVRVGMGTADLRYRPEFPEWYATLSVKFIESSISQESVLSLLGAAGLGVGVGEWRPEKSGQYGQFAIDETKPISLVK